MTTTGPPAGATPPPKTTLFCPACDHRSRYDGDWRVVATPDARRYHCPDCGTVITVRPRFDDDTPHGPLDVWRSTLVAWGDGVRAWRDFWTRTMGSG